MADLLLGTSGYDYPEWKGVFYPKNLKRDDFLLYYSTVFNALELNFSFYAMPTAKQTLSFYERSQGRLKFSMKANRLLTHEISCNWKDIARQFKDSLTPLLQNSSLSAVLFQFPQSFRYLADNRFYLADLLKEFKDFPCVVEFRHREWVRQSVFEGLSQRGAGIVFCDMPMCPSLPDGKTVKTPFIGKNAYIRMHGRNAKAWYASSSKTQVSDSINGSARYTYDYCDEELETFVPVIRQSLKEKRTTQVFFNNHPSGSGAKNAKRLGEMIKAADQNH